MTRCPGLLAMMHRLAGTTGLVLCLACGGCGLRGVHSYAARGVDLSHYRHYAWAPEVQSRTGDPRLDNNDIFREHIRGMIDRQLLGKGFMRSLSPLDAEVLVHYHTSVGQRMDLHELAPWDVCVECTPFIFDAGTVVIDLVDARSQSLLWRGWAEGNVDGLIDDQARLESEIDRIISRIFAPVAGR
jgi:Domain of unknown function (DUF4136)